MKKIIILLDIDDTLILTRDSQIEFNEGLIQILAQLNKEHAQNIEFYYLSSYQPQIILQTINGIGVTTAERLKKAKFRINVINELKSKGINGQFLATMSPRVDEKYDGSNYGEDLLSLEGMALCLCDEEIKTLRAIIPQILNSSPEVLHEVPNYAAQNNIGKFIRAYTILIKKEKEALSLKQFSVNFAEVHSSCLPEPNKVIETKAEMLLHLLKNKDFNQEEKKVVFFDDKPEVIERMESLKNEMPHYIKLETVKIPVNEVFLEHKYDNLLENLLSKIYKDTIDFPISFKIAKEQTLELIKFESALNSDSITQEDREFLEKFVDDMQSYSSIIDYSWPKPLLLINKLFSEISDNKIKQDLEKLRVLLEYQEEIIKYRIELLLPLNKKYFVKKQEHDFVIQLYNEFLTELDFSSDSRISTNLFHAYRVLKENDACDIKVITKLKTWICTSESKLSKFLTFINNYQNDNLKDCLNKMIEELQEIPKFLVYLDKYPLIKQKYQNSNVEDDDKFQERYNAVCTMNSQIFFQLKNDADEETTVSLLNKYFENIAYRRLANYLDKKLYLKEPTTFHPFSFYRTSNANEIKEAAEKLLRHIGDINSLFCSEDLKIIKKSSVSMIYDDYLNEKRKLTNGTNARSNAQRV